MTFEEFKIVISKYPVLSLKVNGRPICHKRNNYYVDINHPNFNNGRDVFIAISHDNTEFTIYTAAEVCGNNQIRTTSPRELLMKNLTSESLASNIDAFLFNLYETVSYIKKSEIELKLSMLDEDFTE